MLSQEVIDQFLKDIHGEEGKTILLIFADYLEENDETRLTQLIRRRKPVKSINCNYNFGYGLGCMVGCGVGYSLGYALGNGYGYGNGYPYGYSGHSDCGIGRGYGYSIDYMIGCGNGD